MDNWNPDSAGPAPARKGRATRWVIGAVAVAALAGGGIALASAGGAAPASAASGTGTKAALSTVLSAASSPTQADLAAASPSSSSPATPQGRRAAAAHPCAAALRLRASHPAAARRLAARHPARAGRPRAVCRGRLARLRLQVRGIHGQFTYETKQGPKTLGFERGKVTSVTGSAVTVAAADGTTWTWHLVSDTVIRKDHQKVTASALSDGERVFAGGPVSGGTYDARLVVIGARKSGSATTTPAS